MVTKTASGNAGNTSIKKGIPAAKPMAGAIGKKSAKTGSTKPSTSKSKVKTAPVK